MEQKNEVGFVIVNYRSQDYLSQCLKSIKDNIPTENFSVVIVNNDNEKIDLSFPDLSVEIIENRKNLGFSKGANQGARAITAPYLCFLNPDAEIVSGDFLGILKFFQDNPRVGIVGPKIIESSGKIQPWSAGNEITLSSIVSKNIGLFQHPDFLQKESPSAVAWVSGACLLIKRELFEQLGGFDETFFMYFEDVDLCKRSREIGFSVLFCPSVTIRHQGGASFDNTAFQKNLYFASQDAYLKKHFGAIVQKIAAGLRFFSGKT
jgi:GT2 family glycosyltransferase